MRLIYMFNKPIIVKEKAKFVDNIHSLEKDFDKKLRSYAIFLICLLILLLFYPKVEPYQLVSSFFISIASWVALYTWKKSFIFGMKQNRRELTMQRLQSYQMNAEVLLKAFYTLKTNFPDYFSPTHAEPIPSLTADGTVQYLRKIHTDLTDKELGEVILELRTAMGTILNLHEHFAVSLKEGYLDESYLKKTMRGQIVRSCSFMSNFIVETRQAHTLSYEHLVDLYDLWHIKQDGDKSSFTTIRNIFL